MTVGVEGGGEGQGEMSRSGGGGGMDIDTQTNDVVHVVGERPLEQTSPDTVVVE